MGRGGRVSGALLCGGLYRRCTGAVHVRGWVHACTTRPPVSVLTFAQVLELQARAPGQPMSGSSTKCATAVQVRAGGGVLFGATKHHSSVASARPAGCGWPRPVRRRTLARTALRRPGAVISYSLALVAGPRRAAALTLLLRADGPRRRRAAAHHVGRAHGAVADGANVEVLLARAFSRACRGVRHARRAVVVLDDARCARAVQEHERQRGAQKGAAARKRHPSGRGPAEGPACCLTSQRGIVVWA